MTLEVELSFSAGMAASAAAVAWYLYGYCRDVGFESISTLCLVVLWFTLVELFSAALVVHLLYRGAWMATRLLTGPVEGSWSRRRSDVQDFDADLVALDRRCRAVFHGAFRFLYRGCIGALVMTGVVAWIATWGPVLETAGLVVASLAGIQLLLRLLGSVPFLARARAFRDHLERRNEQALRLVGLWWVSPPHSQGIREPGWLPWLRVAATFGLFYWNVDVVGDPTLASSQPVYSKSEHRYAVLHFRQGGMRGDAESEAAWRVETTLRPRPEFQRLDLNHYVAHVPLADLEPGVYQVSAQLELRQVRHQSEGSRFGFVLSSEPVDARFLVVE